MREQALYCLNNIATAHEAAQLAIASRTVLLGYLLLYLVRPRRPECLMRKSVPHDEESI